MSRKHGRDIAAGESQPQQQQEEEDPDAFTLLGRTVIHSLFLSFIPSSESLRAPSPPVDRSWPLPTKPISTHVASLAAAQGAEGVARPGGLHRLRRAL